MRLVVCALKKKQTLSSLKGFFFLIFFFFRVFIKFVTKLLQSYVLVFWLEGIWDLSFPTN